MAEALKADARDDKQRQEAQNALRQADAGQQKMLAALDAMLEKPFAMGRLRKFHEELSRVKREQEQLAAETTEQLRKQLTNEGTNRRKRRKNAKPRRPASAKSWPNDKRRRPASLSSCSKTCGAICKPGSNSRAPRRWERALKAAEQSNPAADMRDAGQMLRGDQLGKAPEKQQAALEKLGEVMKALIRRSSTN